MQQAATRVLKKDQISLGGTRRVGDGGDAPAGGMVAGGTARIVQQDAGGAIVEITCRCGETIRLRCSY